MSEQIYEYAPNHHEEALTRHVKHGIYYIPKKKFQEVMGSTPYSIVGRTKLKEAPEDYDKAIINANGKDFQLDRYPRHRIKGYIPVGENQFVELVSSYVPLLLLLFFILAAIIITLIVNFNNNPGNTVLAPDASIVPVESDIQEETDYDEAIIDLPEGNIHYESKIYNADSHNKNEEDYYNGQVTIRVTTEIDGKEHVVFEQPATVQNGQAADFQLDYTILDFELIAGSHEGIVTFTYPDGTVVTKPVQYLVRQSNSGSMSIGYSYETTVDLNSGNISVFYEPDADASHDTVVQLILIKDGQEYLLAESGRIKRGSTLSTMNLNEKMKGMLQTGVYNGVMRLYFYSEADTGMSGALNTDIEVSITVQ